MRDVLWRMAFTLAALVLLLFLGPGVSCNLDTRLMDQIQGETPQSHIAEYLAAVAEGDRQAALALWVLPGTGDGALEARRESMTEDLLGYGPRLEYRVLEVQWWRTCCEPGIVDDSREADAARFLVAVSGEDRPETLYRFDVLATRDDGAGTVTQPSGQWALADIYAQDGNPLAWTRR